VNDQINASDLKDNFNVKFNNTTYEQKAILKTINNSKRRSLNASENRVVEKDL